MCDRLSPALRLFFLIALSALVAAAAPGLDRLEGRSQPRSVVFVLTDDHRYDALGFLDHPFLETPSMDRLAREGVHFRNGYVTTALCSPSRASILTGQYAHKHRVVDNQHVEPEGTVFFPEYLKQAGYQTAFIGKWHMGHRTDAPRPGFDRWVSFSGQGTYYPNENTYFNVDGQRVRQTDYVTDELTDYAVDWLDTIDSEKPFFLYLSHKGVHSNFMPAERHRGRYAGKKFHLPVPPATDEFYALKPMWLKNQRNSFHGADTVGYGLFGTLEELYQSYCETLLSIDESLGRVMTALEEKGLLDSTLVVYMGDNGFCFGDQGTIDKRHAYDPSIRVPFLARCPELFEGGKVVSQVVANIDIAPTVLELAGLAAPPEMDGQSFVKLTQGAETNWRDHLLYEYYWEWNYPQTPTMFALRTERYKYIYYYGLWDMNELYDMEADPGETRNLIVEREDLAAELNQKLFERLAATDGLTISVNPNRGPQWNQRVQSGTPAADFPEHWVVEQPDRTKNRRQ